MRASAAWGLALGGLLIATPCLANAGEGRQRMRRGRRTATQTRRGRSAAADPASVPFIMNNSTSGNVMESTTPAVPPALAPDTATEIPAPMPSVDGSTSGTVGSVSTASRPAMANTSSPAASIAGGRPSPAAPDTSTTAPGAAASPVPAPAVVLPAPPAGPPQGVLHESLQPGRLRIRPC